jgi:opacity protein-like surface antigen
MRKTVLFFMLFFIWATPTYAQDCCPKWEIFGKYIYLNSSSVGDSLSSDQFNNRYGQNGIGASFAANVKTHLGVVFDFGYNRRSSTIGGLTVGGVTLASARTNNKTYTYLFGPRFYAHSADISYFAHALAGAVTRKTRATGMANASGLSGNASASSTDFALGFGMGVDIGATKHVAVRLFQFDYIPVRTKDDVSGDAGWGHNFRLQAGIGIRWGLAR